MTILLSITGQSPTRWSEAITRAAPGRPLVLEPAGPADPEIRYAVVWKQPTGVLADLPNLKAIFSIGAGVDHIMADKSLPDLPIVRIVADDLTVQMTEYVVWRVLDHARRGMTYRAQQSAGVWHTQRAGSASGLTVGIMGLGELGQAAARALQMLGFGLAGWSRGPKSVAGVACFHGAQGLDAFLAHADILVVLLPLTPETRGIIDAPFLARLKKQTPIGGPVLINAGRGGLQVEAALLSALDDGVLMEASLDVFETEPLPAASRLWSHPRVFVTPHAASISNPDALAPLIVRQIEAYERGEPLRHVVDRRAGY